MSKKKLKATGVSESHITFVATALEVRNEFGFYIGKIEDNEGYPVFIPDGEEALCPHDLIAIAQKMDSIENGTG